MQCSGAHLLEERSRLHHHRASRVSSRYGRRAGAAAVRGHRCDGAAARLRAAAARLAARGPHAERRHDSPLPTSALKVLLTATHASPLSSLEYDVPATQEAHWRSAIAEPAWDMPSPAGHMAHAAHGALLTSALKEMSRTHLISLFFPEKRSCAITFCGRWRALDSSACGSE